MSRLLTVLVVFLLLILGVPAENHQPVVGTFQYKLTHWEININSEHMGNKLGCARVKLQNGIDTIRGVILRVKKMQPKVIVGPKVR